MPVTTWLLSFLTATQWGWYNLHYHYILRPSYLTNVPQLESGQAMTQIWVHMTLECILSLAGYPYDGVQILCDLPCPPLQSYLLIAPLCSLCFSSLSHMNVLDLMPLWVLFVCLFLHTKPSSVIPFFLCLDCGISHLSRFNSNVNSSMKLFWAPPFLGRTDHSLPGASL